MRNYVAHFDAERTRQQSIYEHLEETAMKAAEFSSVFGGGEIGYRCGVLHDVGKYSKEFQKRIHGDPIKVDHSTAGALEAAKVEDIYSAFCISGHHGGLPDGGNRDDPPGSATLSAKLKRRPGKEIPDYSDFSKEISVPNSGRPALTFRNRFSEAFFIRMLFSCLVDADYLDTERFMCSGSIDRGNYEDMDTLLKKFEQYIESFSNPQNELNSIRCEILNTCLDAAEGERGLYSLTVPTGGGKTLSSLAFALRHCRRQGMERIIYVIPYINIIEQTGAIFSNIFGSQNILEHHSEAGCFKDEGEPDAPAAKQQLAAENWDAPIIVTTSVQFFESLFSNKTSKCRKLHNIAGSVIVFDEAQMLPIKYLKPCVAAISELVGNYGCSAVLCTATQPSLHKLFKEYDANISIEEVYPKYKEIYGLLRRVSFRQDGCLTDEELSERLGQERQVLCIVNSREQAQSVFNLLDKEGCFHLSTLMIALDRKDTLREIRRRLDSGEVCRVISTSLIEAGVDIDFPTVYRAQAGLDSVLQAAGRCNREGKRPPEQCVVHIFSSERKDPPLFAQNIAAARTVMMKHEAFDEPDAIRDYFDFLHYVKGEALDERKIMQAWEKGINGSMYPFASVAERFRLIDDAMYTIYIPNEESMKDFEKLRRGERSRTLFRRLGQHSVSIYPGHYKALYNAGAIKTLDEYTAVLTDDSLYSRETGLSLTADEGRALFG